MTKLILIRHGESAANRAHVFAGHTNVDLEPRGYEQAKLTAQYVYENFKVDKVYASDLTRAFETAKCVADKFGLEVIADKDVREIYGGKWECMSVDALKEKYKDSYVDTWRGDIGKAVCDGGESVKELSERIYKRFTEIARENPDKTVVIATHATPVRAMQSLVLTGGIEQMKDIPWPPNASVTVMEYANGKWKCLLVSEAAHLENLHTTWSDD